VPSPISIWPAEKRGNCRPGESRPEPRLSSAFAQEVVEDLAEQQQQGEEEDGADKGTAALDDQPGAEQVAGDARRSGGDADGVDDLAADHEGDHGRDI